MSSNPVAEILDTFFNKRPAPKSPRVIKVRLTKKQIAQVAAGGVLQFNAGDAQILVMKK